MPFNVSAGISAMNVLEHALNSPINERCGTVECILKEFNPKELHGILPTLVESLFNFNSHPRGWWTSGVIGYRSNPADVRRLREFLSPTGLLMQVLFKLTSDSTCKYEFPIRCLPYPTQRLIEEGNIPPFYLDKMEFTPTGKAASFIQLNAFEYYMMHFAYFLVNPLPLLIKSASCATRQPSSSLYSLLVEDYLEYFFPLEGGSNPPFVPLTNTSSRSSYQPAALQNRVGPYHTFPSRSPGMGQMGPTNFPGLSPQKLPLINDHGWVEKDIWMSEELLQILVEFWLNQSVYANQDQNSFHSSPVTSFSTEHVCIVRVLVKHLHFFVNTLRLPIQSQSLVLVPHWSEFKGLVWPHYVQKKLYRFLRHNFEWWPLDASFRCVLETWLSFIQPWRYCADNAASNLESDSENKEIFVEGKWRQFVSDHILFYSVFFHSFIERAFRLDLSSPKNAYLLFRVSRILCQPNLRDILHESESTLQYPFDRFAHSTSQMMNSSYRSMNSPAPNFAVQFADLEGLRFQYRPILCLSTEKTIKQLLRVAYESMEKAKREFDMATNTSTSWLAWLGFTEWIQDYNAPRYYTYESTEELKPGEDSKRAKVYLEQIINSLCSFFELEPPSPTFLPTDGTTAGVSPLETSLPDVETTDSGLALTPLGRYQMINGLKKFDISYEGDPDLQPIRSFECAFLVRLFYGITSFLNTRLALQLSTFYHRKDFVGRVARQFLQAPPVGESPVCSNNLSPIARQRMKSNHQPRISLRWLANYQIVGYILFFFLVLQYCPGDVSMVAYFTMLIILYLLFLIAKAFFAKQPEF